MILAHLRLNKLYYRIPRAGGDDPHLSSQYLKDVEYSPRRWG